MLKALPLLIILGLAIYSFFDVLNTSEANIRRGPKTMWMILALVPVIGAAFWFFLGRPVSEQDGYSAPRVISVKGRSKQIAPDDDPKFLRRLEDEAWNKKRREARSKEQSAKTDKSNSTTDSSEPRPKPETKPNPNRSAGNEPGSTPGSDGEPKAKEQSPGEQDL